MKQKFEAPACAKPLRHRQAKSETSIDGKKLGGLRRKTWISDLISYFDIRI